MSDYTTTDLCKMYGVTPITLRRWMRDSLLPKCYKQGNGDRYARNRWEREKIDAHYAMWRNRHTVPILDPDRDPEEDHPQVE